MKTIADFDAVAMFEAMDAQRVQRGLSWKQAADDIWKQSSTLNQRRPGDHPISPSTLTNIAKRRDTTCQHALFILRWLSRSPESFLNVPPASLDGTALPAVGSDLRLRWNLRALYDALDERRRERGLKWSEVAREIRCSEHQLKGIRVARYAIAMRLAMRIVQWLDRPAAAFVSAARW